MQLHLGYPEQGMGPLPRGRNLSLVDIAKCEPQVFSLEKTLKIGKDIINAIVLVLGRQILENSD